MQGLRHKIKEFESITSLLHFEKIINKLIAVILYLFDKIIFFTHSYYCFIKVLHKSFKLFFSKNSSGIHFGGKKIKIWNKSVAKFTKKCVYYTGGKDLPLSFLFFNC
jgi:hypothetical protein